MCKMFKRWMERSRVAAQLHQMSDYDLRDIGLTRGEISRVVSEIQ